MLSYRHAFHAGNHADVLKHLILLQIAQYMGEKAAPFWIIDTHAGAGRYALESVHATKLGEYRDGVGRLWDAKGLPPAALDYLDFIKQFNPDGVLRHYPGSPWLASQVLRESDRLRLYELHSTDVKLLQECFKGAGRQVNITAGDGFVGLKALIPPPPRRALVLIDPSYETKSDYTNVVKALKDSLSRFATGTYALWYPVVLRAQIKRMIKELEATGIRKILQIELAVRPDSDQRGMTASGMIVINPPWKLEQQMNNVLPWLHSKLVPAGTGHATVSWIVPE